MTGPRSRLLVAGCTLVAFVLLGLRVQADDADKNAQYTVIIKKVEVAKTQKNGSAWDINDGKPDLMVIVRNMSEKSDTFKSKEKADTFVAEFNEPTTIKFRLDQVLEFEVVDVDVAANDTIGKKEVKVTTESLKKKGMSRLEAFDQVIYLELEFKKL